MAVIFRDLLRLVGLAAQPSSPADGDIWWRSNQSQLHASDGLPGLPISVGPVGNLPAVRATCWHNLPPQGNVASVSVPSGRLYALPFWPGRSTTLTAVAVNVTVALVGGNIRMGLYESDGNIPTNLVADYGTVSSGVTGIRQISGLSTSMRPVLYFFVVARQGGALTLTLSSRDTWDPVVSETTATLDSNRNTYYRDTVTGALPSAFGAIAGTVQGPSATVQLT